MRPKLIENNCRFNLQLSNLLVYLISETINHLIFTIMITVTFIRQNEIEDVFKINHHDVDIEDYYDYYPKGMYTAKELEEITNS